MKLSSRSRYGTRLMFELAIHYRDRGFLHLRDVAKHQDISLKYLEQIIMPLKKSRYVKSARGARGGYRLAKPPETITVGEIVALLEKGAGFVECVEKPDCCSRSGTCLARSLWKEVSKAIYDRLNAITLSDLLADSAAGKR